MISRQVIALGRGTALFGLSAVGLVAFVLHLLVIPAPWGWGVPPVVVGSRRLTNRYRRLARRWCGVEITEPYAPAPYGYQGSNLPICWSFTASLTRMLWSRLPATIAQPRPCARRAQALAGFR